ncbi:MAG: polysaccharide biosynthesis/export family protein [Bacteroidales bacterium]|jgi:polysaccharide export outer membrane protein|nr:polysaccharide biosynthesis/export family protein [Bacteroidales bacterium]
MKMNRFILLLSIVVITLTSCTSQKNLIYFQTENQGDYKYTYEGENVNFSPNYYLAKEDMLYIDVMAIDDETARMFASKDSRYSTTENSIYLNGYVIDKNGEINLPVVGKVKIEGLTVEQAQNAIQEKVDQYIQGAVVSCKMLNYKVSILGEVNRPGTYTFYQPCVSLFQLIAAAGDLTYYGNREKVKIIRKTKTEDIVYTVDLRNVEILQNKHLYLQPGDVVYVEPNKNTKTLSTLNIPLTTISNSLVVLTSVISIFSWILSLNSK